MRFFFIGRSYGRGAGVGRARAIGVVLTGGIVALGVAVGLGGGSLGVGTAWHQTSVEFSGVPSLP